MAIFYNLYIDTEAAPASIHESPYRLSELGPCIDQRAAVEVPV